MKYTSLEAIIAENGQSVVQRTPVLVPAIHLFISFQLLGGKLQRKPD